MVSFLKIAALFTICGVTFAQEQPCYNAYVNILRAFAGMAEPSTTHSRHTKLRYLHYRAAPNQGIGNHCQCADGGKSDRASAILDHYIAEINSGIFRGKHRLT